MRNIIDKITYFEFDHFRGGRIFKRFELRNHHLVELKGDDFNKLKVVNKISDVNDINQKINSLLDKFNQSKGGASIDNEKLSFNAAYFTTSTGTDEMKLNTIEIVFGFHKEDKEYFNEIFEEKSNFRLSDILDY